VCAACDPSADLGQDVRSADRTASSSMLDTGCCAALHCVPSAASFRRELMRCASRNWRIRRFCLCRSVDRDRFVASVVAWGGRWRPWVHPRRCGGTRLSVRCSRAVGLYSASQRWPSPAYGCGWLRSPTVGHVGAPGCRPYRGGVPSPSRHLPTVPKVPPGHASWQGPLALVPWDLCRNNARSTARQPTSEGAEP
jgi:hypothetical protein